VSKIRGLDPLADHLGTTASTLDTMEDSWSWYRSRTALLEPARSGPTWPGTATAASSREIAAKDDKYWPGSTSWWSPSINPMPHSVLAGAVLSCSPPSPRGRSSGRR